MAYVLKSNFPLAGFIAWENLHIVYDGVDYPITDASTDKKYAYWRFSTPNVLQTSDNLPFLGPDDGILFINNGGLAFNAITSSVIDGSLLAPGTIQDAAIEALAASKVTGQLSNEQIAAVEAAKLLGQIQFGQIGIGAVAPSNFIEGIEPVTVVDELPMMKLTETVFLVEDKKIYRWNGFEYTKVVDAEDIAANSITAGQIAAGAITADRIDTRGLSIKDEFGNIIFAAGTALDFSLVGGATRPAPNATRNVNRGNWSSSSTINYVVGDEVQYQGSTFVAILDHVSSAMTAPPTLPLLENTYWQIRAAKGEQGEQGITYDVEIESTNGIIFRPGMTTSTLLIAHVFLNGTEVTNDIPESRFRWRRVSYYPRPAPNDDATWNAQYASGYKQISITLDSVESRATFHCDITE